jgi:hypothetical protein
LDAVLQIRAVDLLGGSVRRRSHSIAGRRRVLRRYACASTDASAEDRCDGQQRDDQDGDQSYADAGPKSQRTGHLRWRTLLRAGNHRVTPEKVLTARWLPHQAATNPRS